ncbi:uncharacterized protein BCR38DRAFT_459938 [Pseudomassariella vexata]|uniref:Cyclase-domain-containing protein n=1 Tax=Pseudomassariella vexata TaxID=1141098 RepID=A0A1Y2DP23_9PEZI|nr:uncharacterized protein BCR38DRAFT_459938 [Pseudomassariella vexata]ORY61028.1 hypothetical protein BCR38DRAFT_459938 [Pseudomassariella vexata]
MPPRPPFSSLPLDPNGPPGNAWGLYGNSDKLGALNLLTPNVVAEAASEIRTGEHPFEWKLCNRGGRSVNDDHVNFNTQCSSQWDGFRHYGYQKAIRFYNNTSQADLEKPENIGIDAWVEKGGVVGRGVLLDYLSYCHKRSIPLSAMSSVAIPLSHLKELVQEHNIIFRPGDILFLRSGFTLAYESLSLTEQKALACRSSPDFIGLEATKEVLQWIWESGFAAVASDTPSFERAPIAGPHTAKGGQWEGEEWEDEIIGGGLLHQWLLAGWGLPIGEMFDLENLSRKCEELKRWTFFVSSVPLKVPGGVASPPNAIAIF